MSAPLTIRELCAKATPGPWTADNHPADRTILIHGPEPKMRWIAELSPQSRLDGMEHDANAQLIARLSPDVVLKVVDALERANNAVPPNTGAERMIQDALRLLNAPNRDPK